MEIEKEVEQKGVLGRTQRVEMMVQAQRRRIQGKVRRVQQVLSPWM